MGGCPSTVRIDGATRSTFTDEELSMETDLLNEYLFADLVVEYADSTRRRRVRALVQAGEATQEEMTWGHISTDDLRTGLELLEQRRSEVLELVRL
jgi:hypothetical protein